MTKWVSELLFWYTSCKKHEYDFVNLSFLIRTKTHPVTLFQNEISSTYKKRIQTFEMKGSYNNYMMAKTRDEVNALSNGKKEARIILTGLTNYIPMPMGVEEKKAWLNKMIYDALNRIDPSGNRKIIFIKQGKGNGHFIPLAEVKLDSKEAAFRIWSSFVALRKAGSDLENYTLQIMLAWPQGSDLTF